MQKLLNKIIVAVLFIISLSCINLLLAKNHITEPDTNIYLGDYTYRETSSLSINTTYTHANMKSPLTVVQVMKLGVVVQGKTIKNISPNRKLFIITSHQYKTGDLIKEGNYQYIGLHNKKVQNKELPSNSNKKIPTSLHTFKEIQQVANL